MTDVVEGLLTFWGWARILPAAYVGPGAAISLLGALLAVIGAIFLTFFGALLWPVRALWRKITGGTDEEAGTDPAGADEEPAGTGEEENV